MTLFALVDDVNALVTAGGRNGFYRRDDRPPDPVGKPWRFLQVERETGTPAFEGVDGTRWLIRTPPPPEPTYRENRMRAYIEELGPDPHPLQTLGDVLDEIIKELRARGAAETQSFADIAAKIDDIKARFPKA